MGKLRVLMYHKVSPKHRDFLTVSVEQLQWQLDYVQKHFTVVKLSDVIAHIEKGKTLPKKALLITFDDGYADNFELAYPEFKSRQLPFCIFLVADFINKQTEHDGIQQQFLSHEQIADMAEYTEFAYHSLAHENLMQIDPKDWLQHIQSTKAKCAELPMLNAWAYTYGQFPKHHPQAYTTLKEAFKTANISVAFRIGNRLNQLPLAHPYKVQRIDVKGHNNKLLFKLRTWFGKMF